MASPGVFEWEISEGPAVWILSSKATHADGDDAKTALEHFASLRRKEQARRKKFPSPLHRAGDAYIVKRGEGKTLIAGTPIADSDIQALHAAVDAILTGYAEGTRFSIHAEEDGLLACGQPGVQLTWMDAKVGDWVVTPRIGKPVEVEALWLNALWVGSHFSRRWKALFEKGKASFEARFWNESASGLFDVLDCDHRAGVNDPCLRPNQIFAVGGLPLSLLDGERARRIVETVEANLLTPIGLRSLGAKEPAYVPRYEGGVAQRDGSYHQGTVWPWLIGPFVEAWLRIRVNTKEAKAEARKRFLDPFRDHLLEAGLGHISEIADAEPPHTPRGCPFQAWSIGELIRLESTLLG